jgi:sporulation protein YlmC with PRC-barrel domain
MDYIDSPKLQSKKVFSQDGREVGEIEGFSFDSDWNVVSFTLRVRREVLEELGLKKPMMGTQTVELNVDQVSGLSDSLILRTKLSEVLVTGGKAAG